MTSGDAASSGAGASARRRLDPRLAAVLAAAAAGALLLPFDARIVDAVRGLRLPSDLESELDMVQQYGQFTATLLGSLLVVLLDPHVRRRLLDWWAALGLTSLACHTLKMTLGRPRPKLGDPYVLTLPWEHYVRMRPEGPEVLRALRFDGSDLWSLPSAHTAAAVVMSLFLARLYPPLRPFAVGMAVAVGLIRVLFVAHWPTDVVAGALLGYLVADAVWRGRWGDRLAATLLRRRAA